MSTNKPHTPQTLNVLPWAAGAVLLLGLAAYAGIYWSGNGNVERVKFKGHHYVSEQDLQQAVQIPLGTHPDSLNMADIIKQFEAMDYVQQASVEMAPGGTLTIAIEERRPLALLVDGSYRAYVDAAGLKLPQKLGLAPDVPLLYGFSARSLGDTLQSEAFQSTSLFLQALQQHSFADATISEVAWSKREGIVAMTNEGGVKLTFGTGDYETRLKNWEAFYAKVIPEKGIDQVTSVDLRFKGQIVTREK